MLEFPHNMGPEICMYEVYTEYVIGNQPTACLNPVLLYEEWNVIGRIFLLRLSPQELLIGMMSSGP